MNDEPDPNAEMFRRLDTLPWRKATPSPNADLPVTSKGKVMFVTNDENYYVVLSNGNIRGHCLFTSASKAEALHAGSIIGLCDPPGGLSSERRAAIEAEVESKLPTEHRINGENVL